MSTLYEIDKRLSILEEYNVDNETGEYLSQDDFQAIYNSVQMDLNSKIENTIMYIKDLLADAEIYKKEAKTLVDRATKKEKLATRLKLQLDNYVKSQCLNDENLKAYTFETIKGKISYVKSSAVNVVDINKLPEDFIRVKTTIEPNKVMLKNYLQHNNLEGAEIVTSYNIKIQ